MTRYFFDRLNRAMENLIDWRCQACEEAVQVAPALDHATIDETTQEENETSRQKNCIFEIQRTFSQSDAILDNFCELAQLYFQN